MRLSDYEKEVRREVDKWEKGSTLFQQVLDWAMMPVDWVVDQVVPDSFLDQASDLVEQGLGVLNDASEWTYSENDLVKKAIDNGIEIEALEDLRDHDLEELDTFAKSFTTENALLAAVQGGGAGLGGIALVAADIPLLFTINFRLIQQVGAAYGFSMKAPEFKPLILSIYNVASSGSREAKTAALKETSVAAAAFAHDFEYKGRGNTSTFREQNKHLPREIAKNLAGRKLGQMIPLAGAAIGAGVNYWFTSQTAEAAHMLFRALYLERKERA